MVYIIFFIPQVIQQVFFSHSPERKLKFQKFLDFSYVGSNIQNFSKTFKLVKKFQIQRNIG